MASLFLKSHSEDTESASEDPIPATVPGEVLPPCQQKELSESEKEGKNKTVMDIAGEMLCGYWNGKTIKHIPISSSYLP